MQIVTLARGFTLTTDVRQHIERRLGFAFDRAHHQIGRISVVVSDVNGPRGGEDKRCRIEVSVAGAADVMIDDCQSDLYRAIDRAVDRAGRTLARRLTRLRDGRHGRPAIARSAAVSEAADQTEPQI